MRTTGGVILVALAMGLATAAAAQPPAVSETERTAPMLPNEASPQVSKSPPVLFSIGPVPVRMWAPVQSSYDASANRAPAENPWWITP